MWVTDFGRDCHCGILNMVMVIEAIDLGRMFSVVNMQDVRMVLTDWLYGLFMVDWSVE